MFVAGDQIERLRWPAEEARRAELAALGTPRLLLVEPNHEPPVTDSCLEDWIRVPAPERDIAARVAALIARWRGRRDPGTDKPVLDEAGLVRFRGSWSAIPPVEARLLEALIERYGRVVSRDALAKAGWPTGCPGRNALDVHVLRLRRRLTGVGLVIRTVRARGYLLEPGDPTTEMTGAGPGSSSHPRVAGDPQ